MYENQLYNQLKTYHINNIIVIQVTEEMVSKMGLKTVRRDIFQTEYYDIYLFTHIQWNFNLNRKGKI